MNNKNKTLLFPSTSTSTFSSVPACPAGSGEVGAFLSTTAILMLIVLAVAKGRHHSEGQLAIKPSISSLSFLFSFLLLLHLHLHLHLHFTFTFTLTFALPGAGAGLVLS
jgi:hypothetical protein